MKLWRDVPDDVGTEHFLDLAIVMTLIKILSYFGLVQHDKPEPVGYP